MRNKKKNNAGAPTAPRFGGKLMAVSLTRFKAAQPGAASGHTFQQWLIITGVLVFAVWVAQQYNVVTTLLNGDVTRVSLLISLIFVCCFTVRKATIRPVIV